MNQPTAPAPLPPAPEGMVNVFVDGALLHVKRGTTVMKACEQADKEIPHFCYHNRLSIAGNCRMCLVEVEGMPKPVASCHWPVAEGMRIKTDSPITHIARKGTMELLLANHPLDCPICDQGGECTLQDLAVGYGSDRSHFHEMKRAVDDKFIGSKIKTVMTRCIHCTRCVRFATEIAGVEEFGATGRGENMQIGTYVEKALVSEFAGNMIDLCPVGALTNAQYAFKARPWELVETATIDILEPCHASISVHSRAGEVLRVVPRDNPAINEEWIADTTRFAVDALVHNRLTTPMLNLPAGAPSAAGAKAGATKPKTFKVSSQSVGWPQAFAAIRQALLGERSEPTKTPKPQNPKTPCSAALIAGPLLSREDLFAAQQFMQSLTQSPSHPASQSPIISALPTNLPSTLPRNLPNLAELEKATAVLLIGTNPRQDAPLLNLRLRKAARKGAKIYNLGTPANLTYPAEELGTSPAILNAPSKHLLQALSAAGAPKSQNPETPKSHILLGYNALTRKDAPAILVAAQKLAAKSGASLAIVHPTTGTLAALDLQVQTTAPATLLKSADKLAVLFVYGDHPALTPDALKAIAKTTFVVYLGTHLSPLAAHAHVCLPTAAFTEKSATYTNLEGIHQTTTPATPPPHNAKEDWKIFRALSEELGTPLPFDTLAQLRAALANALLKSQDPNTPKSQNPISATPLTAPTTSIYLANPFLTQSPWMHRLAAETAPAKKGAAA